MNLIEFAKKELEIIKSFDDEDDLYSSMIEKSVLELIEVFAKQEHSGMSASIVRQLFNKLTQYKPLSPLTFRDDEWIKVSENLFQNKRNPAVFKDEKGKPYYNNAYYIETQNGTTYTGSLWINENKRIKRCYIKDSGNMPTIKINVIEWEVDLNTKQKKEGTGYWLTKLDLPIALEQLAELEKYYEVEYEFIN